MRAKKKNCTECGALTYIFSKGRCQACASKTYKQLDKTGPSLRGTSFISRNRHSKTNKAKREGLGDFMRKHVDYIKENKICCENCGIRLIGHVGEVAHILSKEKHPEVMKEDNNIVYLCFNMTNNSNRCHETFDYSLQRRREMPVNELAKKRIESFSEKVLVMSEEFLSLYHKQ